MVPIIMDKMYHFIEGGTGLAIASLHSFVDYPLDLSKVLT